MSVALGGTTPAAGIPQAATGRPSTRADDQLAALIANRDLTPGAIAIALVLAFVLGAGHALTPGHGKTIVAAYLVGARGTARHAIFLGLTTTLTHTAGVFLLGFVTLAISRYILPEQIYPWLEFASGLMVVIIGIALFRSRLLLLLQHNKANNQQHNHEHGPHTHTHEHEPHTHNHSAGWLDSDHEHGPDTHTHDHDHALADWASGSAAGQPEVSWRSLLALGVSGGLIPCPSALVVLLGAIALGRIGFGLLLIVSFSLGLASVLTALGMLLVYARGLFENMPMNGVIMKALPVVSAVLVTIAGGVITYGGLVQAGIVRFS
jgi:ABC-type nickel/cobalt efflux system permease component RcnA